MATEADALALLWAGEGHSQRPRPSLASLSPPPWPLPHHSPWWAGEGHSQCPHPSPNPCYDPCPLAFPSTRVHRPAQVHPPGNTIAPTSRHHRRLRRRRRQCDPFSSSSHPRTHPLTHLLPPLLTAGGSATPSPLPPTPTPGSASLSKSQPYEDPLSRPLPYPLPCPLPCPLPRPRGHRRRQRVTRTCLSHGAAS